MSFLHKTTWREYFDALSFLRCERWLCAPFSFFTFYVRSMLSTESKFSVRNCTSIPFFLFFLFFCVLFFLKKTTWREYFDILSFLNCERWSCTPFFSLFDSSFFKNYLKLKLNQTIKAVFIQLFFVFFGLVWFFFA